MLKEKGKIKTKCTVKNREGRKEENRQQKQIQICRIVKTWELLIQLYNITLNVYKDQLTH
jgi:hypothetical protein